MKEYNGLIMIMHSQFPCKCYLTWTLEVLKYLDPCILRGQACLLAAFHRNLGTQGGGGSFSLLVNLNDGSIDGVVPRLDASTTPIFAFV